MAAPVPSTATSAPDLGQPVEQDFALAGGVKQGAGHGGGGLQLARSPSQGVLFVDFPLR